MKALVFIVGALVILGFIFPGFWAVAGVIVLIPIFLFVTPVLISAFSALLPIIIMVGAAVALLASCAH